MQRLFLTGLPGAGKSVVGRRVAALLGWEFLDFSGRLSTDTAPATAREQEQGFEDKLVREASASERVVVAIDSDALSSPAVRRLLHEQGLSIYLQNTAETAWQRLSASDEHTKPDQGDASSLDRAALSDLLLSNEALYKEAAVHIATDALTLEAVASQVIVSALCTGLLLAPDSASISSNLRLASSFSRAVIEWGALSQLPEALRALNGQKRAFVVTDSSVGVLYAESLSTLLVQAELEPMIFTVPAGESSKSFACFQSILDWLVEQHAEHTEPIIALGGGVVGDLVGFVAASYQRGVPLVQVPTTLLAQVDSAIGGKTGINHPLGKNLIGAYYQPELIFVDPATLLTLPERAYREGWAEIVKYGVILDAEFFALLEARLADIEKREANLLTQVIARCIRLKMDVVQGDERDSGLRNILNYGHTFGHALEATTEYGTWLHGEAVSIGMEVAGFIAVARGLIAEDDLKRQRALLQAIGLPIACPGVDVEAILLAMQRDKKVRAGRTRWILPTRIGHAQIFSDIPLELMREASERVCQFTRIEE